MSRRTMTLIFSLALAALAAYLLHKGRGETAGALALAILALWRRPGEKLIRPPVIPGEIQPLPPVPPVPEEAPSARTIPGPPSLPVSVVLVGFLTAFSSQGCMPSALLRGMGQAGIQQERAVSRQLAEPDALIKTGHWLCVGWTHRYTVAGQEVLTQRGKGPSAAADLSKAEGLAVDLSWAYELVCETADRVSRRLTGKALPPWKGTPAALPQPPPAQPVAPPPVPASPPAAPAPVVAP